MSDDANTSRVPLHALNVPHLPVMSPLKHECFGADAERASKYARLTPAGVGSDLSGFGLLADTTSLQVAPHPANPWSTSSRRKLEQGADSKPLARAAGQQGRPSLLPEMREVDDMLATAPPRFNTAFELMKEEKTRLSFGDAYLDAPLGGGLCEGITELVGEAACGKTQIAMQLLLQCQLPKSQGGLGGAALYLAIEDFPISRLKSLATSFHSRHPDITHDVFKKIYIKNVTTPPELSAILHGPTLRSSLERGDIKLIVLDSVAAMFRSDTIGKEQDYSQRSQELLNMGAQLKQLSSTFHIPVLAVNQVADFFAGADANGGEALPVELVKHSYLYHWSRLSSGRRVVPALGLTWANCVTTRIFLTRKHEFVQDPAAFARPQQLTPPSSDVGAQNPLINMFTPRPASGSVGGAPLLGSMPPLLSQSLSPTPPPATKIRRFMHVQFAPHLPPSTAEFLIETGGIRGTPNMDELRQHAMPSPTLQTGASPSHSQPFGSPPPTPSTPLVAPQLPFFRHFADAPVSQTVPTQVSSTTFFRNMFTPSGQSTAAASPSPPSSSSLATGEMKTSTAASPTSYFDLEDELGRTEEDERQEQLMLEQAEAQMRQRQQQGQMSTHTVSTADVLNSPVTMPQQLPWPQQQPEKPQAMPVQRNIWQR